EKAYELVNGEEGHEGGGAAGQYRAESSQDVSVQSGSEHDEQCQQDQPHEKERQRRNVRHRYEERESGQRTSQDQFRSARQPPGRTLFFLIDQLLEVGRLGRIPLRNRTERRTGTRRPRATGPPGAAHPGSLCPDVPLELLLVCLGLISRPLAMHFHFTALPE